MATHGWGRPGSSVRDGERAGARRAAVRIYGRCVTDWPEGGCDELGGLARGRVSGRGKREGSSSMPLPHRDYLVYRWCKLPCGAAETGMLAEMWVTDGTLEQFASF